MGVLAAMLRLPAAGGATERHNEYAVRFNTAMRVHGTLNTVDTLLLSLYLRVHRMRVHACPRMQSHPVDTFLLVGLLHALPGPSTPDPACCLLTSSSLTCRRHWLHPRRGQPWRDIFTGTSAPRPPSLVGFDRLALVLIHTGGVTNSDNLNMLLPACVLLFVCRNTCRCHRCNTELAFKACR